MSMSLREQLLQAGFGKKQQAQQAEQQQRSQSRNKLSHEERRRRDQRRSEHQQREAQAQAAKAAREEERNRRRQEQLHRKETWTQIRQLIEQHRLPRIEGEDYLTFNFVDRRKVRRIAVDAPRRERLTNGELVIARCEGQYCVVPAEIAARIRELDERAVVSLETRSQQEESREAREDDPYKDFVVPDDLMW